MLREESDESKLEKIVVLIGECFPHPARVDPVGPEAPGTAWVGRMLREETDET